VPEASDYERLGGRQGVEAVVREFVRRVFADLMIGFHFRDADPERIATLETQFACAFLGGPERYQGRPLEEAHAPHPITGGQFMRRLKILEEVLEERGAPPEVIRRWLAHSESLRARITREAGSECRHLPPA
jgi:hemoglobin